MNDQKNMSKQIQPYHYQGADDDQKSSKFQQYFDPHVSKKKKIIFWIYLLTLLGFIVIIFTLISKSYAPIRKFLETDNFYFANQVVAEWNKGFITDIKVVKSDTNPTCPAGYEYAFDFKWRGTGFGCRCSGGANTSFVLQALCTPALIQVNCANLASQTERTVHYWKNNSNICIKRSTVTFANQKKFDGTNKICGSSQSLVVVPTSEPCPIVNISMTGFNLQDHNFTTSDVNNLLPKIYASFNSTSPYSFYSYPISKFAVSQYQFCQINEDTGLSPEHVDFVLLSLPRGCASQGNYSVIDKTTELNFYQNNPTMFALTQIQGFPQAGNWQYQLGFASLPSWTYKCRHNLNGKYSIQKTSYQFNLKRYSLLQAGTWVIIAAAIVIAIQIFIVSLRRLVNNSIYPVGYKQVYLPRYFWWSLMRYIVDFACKILIIALSAVFTYNGYMDWHWYKQVQNYKCHHDNMEMVQNIILPYQKIHLFIFKACLAVLTVSVVMFIIDLFHFYFIYNNELIYYLVGQNQVLVDKEQAENKNESLDKLNDLKWLQVQNIEQLDNDKNDDELRITMAQNLFANEQNEPQIGTKLKKKKKKIGNNKKLLQKSKDKNQQSNGAGYLFDDDIFGNLDNSQQPTTTILKSSSPPKKKINNRRKK